MASLSDLAAQSNQVAQQNNPEFAALNTIVQSRVMPYEGFGDFATKIAQFNQARQHDKDMLKAQQSFQKQLVDDNYRRNLEQQFTLSGGLGDLSKMSNTDLLKGIHALSIQDQPQTVPVPNMSQSIVQEKSFWDKFNPFSKPQARTSNTDTPTMNASGRVTEKDLININKLYPHLSRTEKGRDFLRRVENTYNQNPYNLAALTPLLKEFQSGSLETVPQNRTIDRSPYKGLKNSTDYAWDSVQGDSPWLQNLIMSPGHAIGIGLANLTDSGAKSAEIEATRYGYIPPIKEENSGMFKSFRDWVDNHNRVEAANKYMDNFKETYKFMKERGIKPIQTSPNDQVTEAYKEQLARKLNLPSTQFIQTGVDGYGQLTLVADGRLFIVDESGNIWEQ